MAFYLHVKFCRYIPSIGYFLYWDEFLSGLFFWFSTYFRGKIIGFLYSAFLSFPPLFGHDAIRSGWLFFPTLSHFFSLKDAVKVSRPFLRLECSQLIFGSGERGLVWRESLHLSTTTESLLLLHFVSVWIRGGHRELRSDASSRCSSLTRD